MYTSRSVKRKNILETRFKHSETGETLHYILSRAMILLP